MNYLIYMYEHPISKLKYIGRTSLINEQQRKRVHQYQAEKFNSSRWYKAINANGGIHNFNYTVLAYTNDLNSADLLEKALINQYKTTDPLFGYNTLNGGGGKTGLNAKPKEYYATKPTQRSDFKNTCTRAGWDFDDFDEIDSYTKYKSGERLFYYHYNAK